MAPPGGTERQTHSQRSRTADRPVQVAATACSTGQGRNVASPAWLEKQPCPQPPAAGVQPSAAGTQTPGAAGLVGGAGPLAPAAVPAPSPVPLVSPAPDGAARPSIAPHPSSVVKKVGSPNCGATVHNPGAPSRTSRHTFALASPSGQTTPPS